MLREKVREQKQVNCGGGDNCEVKIKVICDLCNGSKAIYRQTGDYWVDDVQSSECADLFWDFICNVD